MAEGHHHRSLGCNPRKPLRSNRFLAESQNQLTCVTNVNMAFGQMDQLCLYSWGVAPGYDDNGLRPKIPRIVKCGLGRFRQVLSAQTTHAAVHGADV